MENRSQKNHRDLIVWQKALGLAEVVYGITATFPKHEMFGLTAQIRRAAVSIPSNIAEGAARRTTRDFMAFMHIARGSFAELETQLLLSNRLGYVEGLQPLLEQMDEVGRLINAMIRGLRRRQTAGND